MVLWLRYVPVGCEAFTTDAMFQSIYYSFHKHYFLFWLFALVYCDWGMCQLLFMPRNPFCDWCNVPKYFSFLFSCASWVWSFMLRNPFFIRHCLVILQQMQCSKVFFIPNFIIVIFCYWLLAVLYCDCGMCQLGVKLYAEESLLYKALLSHITTDAMFQSIFHS